ncbi:hypothetical protein EUTSA_v10024102mg [Eutrema salsugineum]|uniref:Uncharacterized protein n=1 Tax=Eutrema salsugineum TaxID=72664 RepID=V4KDI4_EUTSA|nr:hypothetical protein EUTSA_v10024102mg [Eutrema salsugineum]
MSIRSCLKRFAKFHSGFPFFNHLSHEHSFARLFGLVIVFVFSDRIHPLIDLVEDSPELCLIIDDRHKNKITKEAALKKVEAEKIPNSTVIKVSKLKSDLRKLVEEKRFELVGTGICSVVKVAKLSMGRKEIAENVMAAINRIADLIH